MEPIIRGNYIARLAEGPEDLKCAQALRWRAFQGRNHIGDDTSAPAATESAATEPAAPAEARLDADDHDGLCKHMLVENRSDGELMCTYRFLHMPDGQSVPSSYSAQYYDLAGLKTFDSPMVEMGRFCIDPAVRDANVLRLAWGAMTSFVDHNDVEMLFGCTSFTGTEPERYLDSFAMLADRHLAPTRWLPRIKAPRIFPFARRLAARRPDLKAAMAAMPPLLRTYLLMGGWVSDHAVVDHQMNTLHVFTGLEIKAIPPRRRAALRGAPV